MVSSRRSPGSEHGFWVMFDVSRSSGSLLDHFYLLDRALLLFSLSLAYVSHHICLVLAAAPPYYPSPTYELK